MLWIVGGVVLAGVFVAIFVSTSRINAKHQAWVDTIRREGIMTRGRVVDLIELHRARNAQYFSVRVGVSIQDPMASHRGSVERMVWVDGIIGDVLMATTLRIGTEVSIRVRGNDALIEGRDVRAGRALIGGSFPWARGIIAGHHETH